MSDSSEEGSGSAGQGAAKVHGDTNNLKFPEKLFHVLEVGQHADAVVWSPDGKSFIVLNSDTFQATVLKEYFGNSKFSSFVRQLNVYGFRKVPSGRWEFAQENFVKGRSDLLPNLKRRKPRANKDGNTGLLQTALADAAHAIQTAALSMLLRTGDGQRVAGSETQGALAALAALGSVSGLLGQGEGGKGGQSDPSNIAALIQQALNQQQGQGGPGGQQNQVQGGAAAAAAAAAQPQLLNTADLLRQLGQNPGGMNPMAMGQQMLPQGQAMPPPRKQPHAQPTQPIQVPQSTEPRPQGTAGGATPTTGHAAAAVAALSGSAAPTAGPSSLDTSQTASQDKAKGGSVDGKNASVPPAGELEPPVTQDGPKSPVPAAAAAPAPSPPAGIALPGGPVPACPNPLLAPRAPLAVSVPAGLAAAPISAALAPGVPQVARPQPGGLILGPAGLQVQPGLMGPQGGAMGALQMPGGASSAVSMQLQQLQMLQEQAARLQSQVTAHQQAQAQANQQQQLQSLAQPQQGQGQGQPGQVSMMMPGGLQLPQGLMFMDPSGGGVLQVGPGGVIQRVQGGPQMQPMPAQGGQGAPPQTPGGNNNNGNGGFAMVHPGMGHGMQFGGGGMPMGMTMGPFGPMAAQGMQGMQGLQGLSMGMMGQGMIPGLQGHMTPQGFVVQQPGFNQAGPQVGMKRGRPNDE